MAAIAERLMAAHPEMPFGVCSEGLPLLQVTPDQLLQVLRVVRDELGFQRFVDLTAVDDPRREDRFELNYLLYSMAERTWLRVKTRTSGWAPSVVELYPGADWYEREVFDLFGVRFDGHPELARILLPADWQGHPLRRDEPLGGEPVDFTVTREIYGT